MNTYSNTVRGRIKTNTFQSQALTYKYCADKKVWELGVVNIDFIKISYMWNIVKKTALSRSGIEYEINFVED